MELFDKDEEKDKDKKVKIQNYVSDMCQKTYGSREEYDKYTKILRKKYKFVPKKTTVIKAYHELVKEKIIEPNPTFYQYSMKKMGKSSSGVSVITVLTSPTPEYTKDGQTVKQSFSCGCSCAYCPNEPEIRLDLVIN